MSLGLVDEFQKWVLLESNESFWARGRNLLLRTRYDPGIRSSVFDLGALF